jgi:hypothetical protein
MIDSMFLHLDDEVVVQHRMVLEDKQFVNLVDLVEDNFLNSHHFVEE